MNRKINYLRISLTDRCNLRCTYCMPKHGIFLKNHKDILSIEDIEILVNSVIKLGINKIRLTGGEPLLKKNIITLIKKIKKNKNIKELTMTTNGILLHKFAKKLKNAGLDRINISLDSLNYSRFKSITRGGNLNDVLKGINEAIKFNLNPIKINVVLIKNFNNDEILNFIEFSKNKKIQIRFIELMPIGESDKDLTKKYFSINQAKSIIKKKYQIKKIKTITTSGPSENYSIKGGGKIGFIGALSNPFCDKCNRIRVTSDGKIRLCLHKNIEFDVVPFLKTKDEKIITKFLKLIICLKPTKHSMKKDGWGNQEKKMFQIGG